MKITIIGAGNIGSALVYGLLRTPSVRPADITLTDVNVDVLNAFSAKGVTTVLNNAEAVRTADIVVLCVKPHLVKDVIAGFLPSLTAETLLVSVAAGVSLEQLKQYAGNRALFRVIPNTAMAVNESMTCIATDGATAEQDKTVLDFFKLVGKAIKIDESLMNAATVLASCGTAFALRYLRAASVAGVQLGFRPAVAMNMIAQTMAGAAALMEASDKHPEEEIDKVTTPKGVTIKGLNELEHAGFSSAVMRGILAAYDVF